MCLNTMLVIWIEPLLHSLAGMLIACFGEDTSASVIAGKERQSSTSKKKLSQTSKRNVVSIPGISGVRTKTGMKAYNQTSSKALGIRP